MRAEHVPGPERTARETKGPPWLGGRTESPKDPWSAGLPWLQQSLEAGWRAGGVEIHPDP